MIHKKIRYGGVNILTGDLLRGHSDAIILSLLKKKDSYGYELNNLISEVSNNNFTLTEATMYTTLKRLESNELITSYWMDGVNTKRKYYSITNKGLSYLIDHKVAWDNARRIINKFMEENNDWKINGLYKPHI